MDGSEREEGRRAGKVVSFTSVKGDPRPAGMLRLPDVPVIRLGAVGSRRFDLIDRPQAPLSCPLCGRVWASTLASHARSMDDPGHFALFVMES